MLIIKIYYCHPVRVMGFTPQGGLFQRSLTAGPLRGPDGSSDESEGGGIPDPDRAVPNGKRHLPCRRGTHFVSRQHRSLTENNSWQCSVTPKTRQNRG